jgi:putative ABC transport system ATP-binding protein
MLIEMDHATKVYGQDPQNPVFGAKDVNLKINQGDFIALVGPSGSGKTTILNLLAGLISPNSGKIFFQGREIQNYNLQDRTAHRLNHMGFIFQDYQLLPVLTTWENVEFPLQLQKLSKDEIFTRVSWALDQVGLSDKHKRFPHELSGGQQQRVSIARAIASKPALILADEPTANLDSKTAQDIIELFKKLNKEFSLTFIFSTHDQRLINQVKRVLSVQDGQVFEKKDSL